MKFFHLSDLHIGLKLLNKDLKDDQLYIFNQITETAKREQPQAILIAGDIYDKAIPSAEAVETFDTFVTELVNAVPQCTVMIISGNHDSAQRVNCFRKVLSKQNVYMIGMPPQSENEYIQKVTLQDEYGNVNFYLLPFVKPSMVRLILGTDKDGNNYSYNDTIHKLIERENIDFSERNVLVSHQFYLPIGKTADEIERMDSEVRTVGNIDEVKSDVLNVFDYAALGHIHKPMTVGNETYRYCGTPLACSVSEANQNKGIVVVNIKGKNQKLEIDTIPLKPKREIKVIKGLLEDILKQACDDYVSVVITDKTDINFIDMQERLHLAFPNLLEIRRENTRKAEYNKNIPAHKELNPFELCCSFLNDMSEEEQALLKDVINTVKGVN